MSVDTVRNPETSPLPRVSVCVIAFNQKAYIRECLDSILSQQTDFEFEVIVGDDFSTDGTREIILDYAARFPSKVRPILLDRNPYKGCANYRQTHAAARGQYVAHMDGDDVMLPGKLARQVEFLDLHPRCALVGHRVSLMDTESRTNGASPRRRHPEISGLDYLLREHCFFVHSSKMYRRDACLNASCVDEPLFVDFALHVEHASRGAVGYMHDILGGYRQVPGSHTQASGTAFRSIIELTLRSYRRAAELGADTAMVARETARYAFKSAFYCLSRGDPLGFSEFLAVARKEGIAGVGLIYGLFVRLHERVPGVVVAVLGAAFRLRRRFKRKLIAATT